MPGMKLTIKNHKQLNFTFAYESRTIVKGGFDYIRTDLSFLTGKMTETGNKLSAGYSYLNKLEKGAHRIIQQFSKDRFNEWGLISYRVASDQTIENEVFTVRVRGRITIEMPLQSGPLDQVLWYFYTGSEYLSSISRDAHQMEIRITPMLVYRITKRNTAGLGIDYRIKSPLIIESEHNLWLKLIYYLKI